MKKFTKILSIFGIVLSVFLTGCTSEIELELTKDGIINVKFSGAAEQGFTELMKSAAGITGETTTVIFDTDEVAYEMAQNGFYNVKVNSKTGTDLFITMNDTNKKSALFTSNIISVENGKLKATLSTKNLVDFYNSADEQTIQFLDMLLSPVFNDEIMTEQDYIDTLSVFYGEQIGNEIKTSNFQITLINADGSKITHKLPLATLLTLNQTIVLGN